MTYEVKDAIQALEDVCRGTAIAIPDEPPDVVYCGDVVYRLSSGWIVSIFNDCGEWDYISRMEAPDGKIFEYCVRVNGEYIYENPEIGDWQPKCESFKHEGEGCAHWGEYY